MHWLGIQDVAFEHDPLGPVGFSLARLPVLQVVQVRARPGVKCDALCARAAGGFALLAHAVEADLGLGPAGRLDVRLVRHRIAVAVVGVQATIRPPDGHDVPGLHRHVAEVVEAPHLGVVVSWS